MRQSLQPVRAVAGPARDECPADEIPVGDRSRQRLAAVLRVHRASPLHVAGFHGFVATDGPLLVGRSNEPAPAGIATVAGSGLAARSARRLAPTRVGLLPADSLRLLGPAPTSSETA